MVGRRRAGVNAWKTPTLPAIGTKDTLRRDDGRSVEIMDDVLRADLKEAIADAFAGRGASEETLALYARHAALVLAENEHVNLTRITDPAEVALNHYLDCHRLLDFVSLSGRRVLDVGTGAGFPGIPLAIAVPDADFTLLDGTRKKIAVVERAVLDLELGNALPVWGRAEEHLRDRAAPRYDVLVARAVGRLVTLLRLLNPVRHLFGSLVCMKGPRAGEEIAECEAEGLIRHFPIDAVHPYELPAGAGQRAIVVLRGTPPRRDRRGRDRDRRGRGRAGAKKRRGR